MNDTTNFKSSYNSSSLIGDISQCPECNSYNIIVDQARGENVCATCGLVLSHHIIDNAREGRRAFSQIEKVNEIKLEVLFHPYCQILDYLL